MNTALSQVSLGPKDAPDSLSSIGHLIAIIYSTNAPFKMLNLANDTEQDSRLGKCGALVILHSCQEIEGNVPNYKELNRIWVEIIIQSYEAIKFPDVSEISSILFSLSYTSIKANDLLVRTYIDSVCENILHKPNFNNFVSPDVINGYAGLLFSLSYCYSKFESSNCLKAIHLIADKLLSDGCLTSEGIVWHFHLERSGYAINPGNFFEGASGISWSLGFCAKLFGSQFLEVASLSVFNARFTGGLACLDDLRLTNGPALGLVNKVLKGSQVDTDAIDVSCNSIDVGAERDLVQQFLQHLYPVSKRSTNYDLSEANDLNVSLKSLHDRCFDSSADGYSSWIFYVFISQSLVGFSKHPSFGAVFTACPNLNDFIPGKYIQVFLEKRFPITCYLLDNLLLDSFYKTASLNSAIKDFIALAEGAALFDGNILECLRFESERQRIQESNRNHLHDWYDEIKDYKKIKYSLKLRGPGFWSNKYIFSDKISQFVGTVDWPMISQYVGRNDEMTISKILSDRQQVNILSRYSFEYKDVLSLCLNEWEFIINGYNTGYTPREVLAELLSVEEISKNYSRRELTGIVEEITKKYIYHGMIIPVCS